MAESASATAHALGSTRRDGTWPITETRPLPEAEALYFAILRPGPDGKLRQTLHSRSAFNRVVASLLDGTDTYISQAWCRTPHRRREQDLGAITHAWVDLDVYAGIYADTAIETVVNAVRTHCDCVGIPRPSEIIFSGRGFYLKWHLAEIRGGDCRMQLRELNRRLASIFCDLGGDRRACDAARVLRLPGTIHGRTSELVRVVHRETDRDGHVRRHTMEALTAAVHEAAGAEASADAGSTGGVPADLHHFGAERHRRGRADRATDEAHSSTNETSWTRWYQKILADLEILARLRWADQPVPDGWRDLFGFLGAVQLAHLRPRSTLWPEIRGWAQRLLPATFVDQELQAYCATLLSRASQAARGETVVTSAGRTVSPIYTYRKETLRELLAITPAEEMHLHALIGPGERRRRDRERTHARRRHEGRCARADHSAERAAAADARAREIARRREQGETYAAIAEALGITEKAARRCLEHARRRWSVTPGSDRNLS